MFSPASKKLGGATFTAGPDGSLVWWGYPPEYPWLETFTYPRQEDHIIISFEKFRTGKI
jgi:hypothetical protein